MPQNNCYTTSCSETESLDDRVTEPTSPLAPRNITKLLNALNLEQTAYRTFREDKAPRDREAMITTLNQFLSTSKLGSVKVKQID